MRLIGPKPVAPIHEQAIDHGWDFAYFSFPDYNLENEYFNPSLVRWLQQDWLLVRRRRGPVGAPGCNTLEAWSLDGMQPRQRHPLNIPINNPDESIEDPRAIVRGENLIVSFCTYVHGKHGYAHQAMTGVRPGFVIEQPIHIEFGGNRGMQEQNTWHEKNWCPFLHDGQLHISYSLDGGKHIVCATRGGRVVNVHYGKAPAWAWGMPRGGTPPVLYAGHYWTFFHSATEWYLGKRRYHMGVLAFEVKPPFNVTRMARFPLLSGSERNFRNSHAPPCVWPGGAIMRDSIWTVALGINDTTAGYTSIPHADVERSVYVTA